MSDVHEIVKSESLRVASIAATPARFCGISICPAADLVAVDVTFDNNVVSVHMNCAEYRKLITLLADREAEAPPRPSFWSQPLTVLLGWLR